MMAQSKRLIRTSQAKATTSRRQHLKVLRSASLSESTQRAYASDIRHYRLHQGTLPAKPAQVALYLAQWSPTHACATVIRRMAALDRWHKSRGFASPVKSSMVQEAMRGVRRIYGGAQRQVRAITAKDLAKLVKVAQSQGADGQSAADRRAQALRDTAVLLLGFCAALRRSELVALEVGDVEFDRQGALVHIRRSKTDPYGRGETIRIARGKKPALCPIRAVQAWIKHAQLMGLTTEPIFRAVDR